MCFLCVSGDRVIPIASNIQSGAPSVRTPTWMADVPSSNTALAIEAAYPLGPDDLTDTLRALN